MKKENEITNKLIPFIEVHEQINGAPKLINVNTLEVVVPTAKAVWLRCSHWRNTDGLYVQETYEDIKEKIWHAFS